MLWGKIFIILDIAKICLVNNSNITKNCNRSSLVNNSLGHARYVIHNIFLNGLVTLALVDTCCMNDVD